MSKLETILEKQHIAINSDGQSSFQLENLIEEMSNVKTDIDEQIQSRFKELMDKGMYFTTSKKKKKKPSKFKDDPILDKIIDDNDSVLTKGWDGGWETDLLPLPVSPNNLDKKTKKFNQSARRVPDDITEVSDRLKAIQADPNIQKDDVLPENDELL